ncbi:hypothetical protein [Flavobacterium sp. ov086]|uniref:hypothetical protein n=1 Tax=Flavobacterium sp. ov086 TaxID=1761785 RepID=UPI000B75BBC5|nr:hypothetical protein [Flavobacterium sp. ov086]SNR24932.1 hypothetical protein SAMN04487979_101377 [Flavobacterium sp. ov086]
MEKVRLLLELNMTIHELIEWIKLRGEAVELQDSIFGIPNDKYIERVIILYDNTYWVIYAIYDNFLERCYWEDMNDFDSEETAQIAYNELVQLAD